MLLGPRVVRGSGETVVRNSRSQQRGQNAPLILNRSRNQSTEALAGHLGHFGHYARGRRKFVKVLLISSPKGPVIKS